MTEASPADRGYDVVQNVRSRMRDGAWLAADLYLPPAADRPVPALLHRTPYGKQTPLWIAFAQHFAQGGYAVVVQDVRGRWESEGEWSPQVNEGPDGADTIQWIAEQPWCDGSVGMYGASYGGWAQWAAARERPPALRALVSTAAAGRWFEEVQYYHGVFRLQHLQWLNMVSGRTNQDNSLVDWSRVFRHLPVRELDQVIHRPSATWQDWLRHSTFDDYWRRLRLDDDFGRIGLPVLHITGWFDGDQPGALFFHAGMTAQSPAASQQALLIGPWDHAGTRVPHSSYGPLEFGDSALVDIRDLHVQWFDAHLRGASAEPMPAVKYFVMGRNEWREDSAWPPPATQRQRLYLGALATLNDPVPSEPGSDTYLYDPDDPVLLPPKIDLKYRFGTFFQSRDDDDVERSALEQRADVLTYQSDPLTSELLIAGKVWVELHADSDGPDTDWMVWLADHWPDGRSVMVAHGELGARFRDSLEDPEPLIPGVVYRFRIELTEVAHAFPVGHRVALAVTSSSFPRFARNPNTGEPVATATRFRVAANTVHSGRDHPSFLDLPVLPD